MADEELDLAELDAPRRQLEPVKLSFNMKMREEFFARVASRLLASLVGELSEFVARPMFHLLKISYSNEKVHFEIVVDNYHRLLEIGLHFEDGPVSTAAYLRYFDQRILELKHELGHQIELERWTQSWGRIYELWPLTTIDLSIADQAAERMATYITVLQPLVIASGIEAERSAQPIAHRSGPWKRTGKKSV